MGNIRQKKKHKILSKHISQTDALMKIQWKYIQYYAIFAPLA